MSLTKLTNAQWLAVRGLLNTERAILPSKRGPRRRYDLFTVWPRLLLQLAKLTKPNSVVTSAVLLSQLSLTICSKPTSLEIIKGLVRNLFDYGTPLKMFVYAKEVLARVPRIMEFAEEMAFDGRGQPNVGSVRHQRPRKWAIISLFELLVIIWEGNSLFIMFSHMSYIPTHVLHIPSRLSLFTSPEALIFPRSSTRRADYQATSALSSATWDTSTSAVQINQWLKDQSLISYPWKIMPGIVVYRNKKAKSRSTML